MNLIEALPQNSQEYEQFVASQSTGSFLQSWQWGQWQTALGRQIFRFLVKDESSGQTLAAGQAVKMALFFGKFYWYLPYGPVVDLRFKIEDLKLVIQEVEKKFSGAIFIRIEPKDPTLISHNRSLIKSANIQPRKTLLVDLEKSEEQLLLEMHPKTRYNIKLAQKHGVVIEEEFAVTPGFGLYFQESLNLIWQTAQRQGYKPQSKSYFAELIDYFAVKHPDQGIKLHVYKAVYQQKLLVAAVMIDFGLNRTYLFGGSSLEFKNVMAPYLLHFQAMLDAQKQGLRFYDFWGIETAAGRQPGFVRFKLGFGGKSMEYGGAYDLVNNKVWYNVYKSFRKINRLLN